MKTMLSYFKGYDRRSWTVLLAITILPTVYIYFGHHSFFTAHLAARFGTDPYVETYKQIYQFGSAFLLMAVLPILLVKFVLREKLSSFGFRLGDWRFGLKFLLISLPIIALMGYSVSNQADFLKEYPLARLVARNPGHFALYELSYIFYYFAWEFFFRGFVQQGLVPRFGVLTAIIIQTLPSTLLHIGKPTTETLSAIVAGFLLGAVAQRTGTFLYVFIAHYLLGVAADIFCAYGGGLL